MLGPQKKDRFHIFEHQNKFYLYASSIRGFAEISKEAADKINANPDTISRVIRDMEKRKPTPISSSLKPATIYLNVSSSCNLKCVYCYANRGNYQDSQKPMDMSTVVDTWNYFRDQNIPIGLVTFFGGEPLLRYSFLKEVVSFMKEVSKEGGSLAPHFSIITNGVLLDEEKIKYFLQEKISITISVDGPMAIHDALRPTTQNRGTFQSIDTNLKRCIQVGLIPGIEVTYTQAHRKAGITPTDLLSFFQDTYGIEVVIIAPAGGKPGDSWKVNGTDVAEAYAEAAHHSLASLSTPKPVKLQIVMTLMNNIFSPTLRLSHQYCYSNIGENHFAVSTSGEIYPCQMFNDQKDFLMGNVSSSDQPTAMKAVQDRFHQNSKENNQCRDCWAKEICSICPGGMYLETGQIKEIPQHRCDLVKKVCEEVIAFFANKKTNAQR